MTVVVLKQLYALRAQLDVAIQLLETQLLEAQGLTAVPPVEGCPHPPNRQRDATTMGGGPPQIVCLDCGLKRVGTV
jgi:hypothetical protein